MNEYINNMEADRFFTSLRDATSLSLKEFEELFNENKYKCALIYFTKDISRCIDIDALKTIKAMMFEVPMDFFEKIGRLVPRCKEFFLCSNKMKILIFKNSICGHNLLAKRTAEVTYIEVGDADMIIRDMIENGIKIMS